MGLRILFDEVEGTRRPIKRYGRQLWLRKLMEVENVHPEYETETHAGGRREQCVVNAFSGGKELDQ